MNDTDPTSDKRSRAAAASEPGAASQPESSGDEPGALHERDAAAAGPEPAELGELKDRYLRLAAEFDNFRKRTSRERTELWGRAQADVVARLVDTVDDLARFTQVDPSTTDARTMHEGVTLVERNLWKVLEGMGVQRIAAVGVPFNPEEHEAVSTLPASTPARDQTIGAVLQPGYRIGSLLIRPARVVVESWRDDTAPPSAERQGAEPDSGA